MRGLSAVRNESRKKGENRGGRWKRFGMGSRRDYSKEWMCIDFELVSLQL